MKFQFGMTQILFALGLSACATSYTVTPVPDAGQKIHYTQGIPTTYSESDTSAVQVTPYGVGDEGRLTFGIAVFNKARTPANFGVENLSLSADAGTPVKIFTYDALVREAKNRATWAEISLAVAGVASAYAASQNAYATTSGSVSSRYGTTSFYARTYDPGAAYAGAAAAGAATGYGFAQIENSLDNTLARLRGQILRTTTIDPGASFGGSAVTDSLSGSYPHNIALIVRWGNEQHTFQFVATKGDQPAPPIPVAAIAPRTVYAAPSSAVRPNYSPADRRFGIDGARITGASSASANMPDPHGIFVQAVQPQSLAASGGIRSGDIILAFDGKRVESMDDLNRYVAAAPAGSTVTVSIWRAHNSTSVSLPL